MRLRQYLTVVGLSTLVVVAVVGASGQSAFAHDESPSQRINRALVAIGSTPDVDAAGGSARIVGGVPSINNLTPAASIKAGNSRLQISVEGASHATPSELVGTTRSYGNVARGTDIAIRPVDSGVQVLSVMQSSAASSTQRYRLDLPEGVHVEAAGSGFVLLRSDQSVVGTIATPWAKDAAGRSLPTVYTLSGSILTQETDTTGASYPVVADPKITFGLGIYLNLWGWELQLVGSAALSLGGAAVAVICTQTARIPEPISRAAAVLACGYVGSRVVGRLFELAKALWTNGLINSNACYQIDLTDLSDIWKTVGTSNCS